MKWNLEKELIKLKIMRQFNDKTDICLFMCKGKRSEPPLLSRTLGCSEYFMNIEIERDAENDKFNIRFIEFEPGTYELGNYLDISDNDALSKENYLVEDLVITSSQFVLSLTNCCLKQREYSFRRTNLGTHVNEFCYFIPGSRSLEFNHLDGLMCFEGYVDMADITTKTGYSPISSKNIGLNGFDSLIWDNSTSEESIALFKKMVEEAIVHPKVANSPVLSVIYTIKEWIDLNNKVRSK